MRRITIGPKKKTTYVCVEDSSYFLKRMESWNGCSLWTPGPRESGKFNSTFA